MALPIFGGAPAVWSTALVFFQAALLGGYAYSHATTTWLGSRRQVILHLGLAVAALASLPIGIPRNFTLPQEAGPVPSLLGLMLVSVGLPFFMVATSNPLLQRWFAGTGHQAGADPYFLYVPSNLGSLLALVGYPAIVEPYLTLGEQSRLWRLGYILLLLLVGGCAITAWRGPHAVPLHHPGTDTATFGNERVVGSQLSGARRLRWALLAFAPSSLMLSVTTYLATEVAAIPLFWILPLTVYLLTFTLAFARRAVLPHRLMKLALPVLVLPLVMLLAGRANEPVMLLIPLHLLTLFGSAMVCHGELARDRPPPRHLTEFYLWVSTGGVLGGVFNALLAPLIFSTVVEYPLTLVLVCLLGLSAGPLSSSPRQRMLDVMLPLALGGLTVGLVTARQGDAHIGPAVTFGVPATLCLLFARRPVRFGLGVAAILVAGLLHTGPEGRLLHRQRTFFGVHRVTLDPTGRYRLLLHGSTLHGVQSLDPARRLVPLAYFERTGPAGDLFPAAGDRPAVTSIAVVGLGSGSIACHGTVGQRWTFYEIDPAVERLARDPRYFTFLRDCPPEISVVLGDARRSLTSAPDRSYDRIILDAYSGDAPPLHLLTREALTLYLEKVTPDGLLAFHITNRHLDLAPPLAALAEDAGLVHRIREDSRGSGADQSGEKIASRWLVMARDTGDLGRIGPDRGWVPVPLPAPTVWTDEFSSLLPAFVWPSGRRRMP